MNINIIFRIIICILSVCGFFVARHIREHKHKGKRLICVARFDCHAVVHSDYSKFLGLPVETMGMVYYAAVFIAYFFFIFIPGVLPNVVTGLMALLSLSAFLFSVYLISVQAFILKKGCSWCLFSAMISIFIFILTALTFNFSNLGILFLSLR